MSNRLKLIHMDPADLTENPGNFRLHPPEQLAALGGAIEEVGWAGACLYNKRTKRLIDGHARKKLAIERGDKSIPVLVGDWSETDEAKILASLDPIAAMAGVDAQALDNLLQQVQTDSEGLQALLTRLASDAGLYQPEPGADDGEGHGSNPSGDESKKKQEAETFTLVFESEDQSQDWHLFLAYLKKTYPDLDTTPQRINQAILKIMDNDSR